MTNIRDRKPASKAILLARVSSREQEDGYSIDAQKYRLSEHCMRKGLEVLQIFELVESSTVGPRQKFMEAIKFAKKQKEVIAVVVDKVDRLQRSFKESALLNELINEEKIELHFHSENCVIHKCSTSSEKLMWNMNVVMAQSYVDNLRDNVNRSIAQKLREGECVSIAPIGYLHIPGGRKKRGNIVVDPKRAPLIRKLFEEYATGVYTLSQLSEKAEKWGLKNARGKQEPLARSQIHDILCNPFYYGVMYYKKGNKYFSHIYESIISKELFDQCTAVRKGYSKGPFKWRGIDYIFRGLLTCAITDKVVTPETKRRQRADGTTPEIVYLSACNPDNPKRKVYVKEEEILKQVENIFKSLYIEPNTLEKIVEYVKSSAKNERLYYKTRITELNKELNLIKTKLDKLMDFFLEDRITEEEHDNKKQDLTSRRTRIMLELEEHHSADDKFSENMINVLQIAANAYKTFNLLNTLKKRQLINLLLSTKKLRSRKLEFSLRSPFDMFVKIDKNGGWWA